MDALGIDSGQVSRARRGPLSQSERPLAVAWSHEPGRPDLGGGGQRIALLQTLLLQVRLVPAMQDRGLQRKAAQPEQQHPSQGQWQNKTGLVRRPA